MAWTYYKRPKNTTERRKTQCRGFLLHEDGYVVKIRAKRNCNNLPNFWDDIVAFGSGRSWKNFRKNQRKE